MPKDCAPSYMPSVERGSMSDIERVGAQLSNAMRCASAGLEVVQGTEGRRNDIHTALGEMAAAAESIMNRAALAQTQAGQVRETLGEGMLRYTEAVTGVADATQTSSNRNAKWAAIRYDQAGGGGSALENTSIKYLLLQDDRLPAILEVVDTLQRLLSAAIDTSREAKPHANDVETLTGQGHDLVRKYAQEAGIPL